MLITYNAIVLISFYKCVVFGFLGKNFDADVFLYCLIIYV